MITSLLLALGLLSVIPTGTRRESLEGREGSVLVLFPVAGLLLGAFPAAVLGLSVRLLGLPGPLAAILAVLTLALLTGGRHLRDLAATADSLARQEAAPAGGAVGSAGAAAVFLVLLAKVSALTCTAPGAVIREQLLPLLLAAALARWTAVVLAAYSDYAKPEGGSGEWAVRYCGAREMLWSLLLVGLMVVGIGLGTMEGSRWQAVLAAAGCFVLGWGASRYFAARSGGVTEVTLGAVIEVAEALALMIMVARPVLS